MMARFRSLWRAATGRRRFEDDMRDELAFHLDAAAADLEREGVSAAEARRRAVLAFGSVEAIKEEGRESRGLRWIDETARNLRYAARMLARQPLFAASVVGTLALCIAANTIIFTVVDAVLLRPLPYPAPERLAVIATYFEGAGVSSVQQNQDGRMFFQLRDHAGAAVDLAATSGGFTGVNLAVGGTAAYVQQQRISAGFMRVLGVAPLAGREFTAEEDREGGPAAVILSHALWRRLFNEDRSIVGRSVLLRGEPHTVVGIMPPAFRSFAPADVWTPLRPSTTGEGGGANYDLVARLRPGIAWPQADAQIASIGHATASDVPTGTTYRVGLLPLQDGLSDGVRTPLLLVWSAVGLVLLIGCANIAGLLLGRASVRAREIATRVALGAGRAAVLRQLLGESLLLAALGTAAGVALAAAGLGAISGGAIADFGVWEDVQIDWRVLAVTVATSLATALAFGLYPAVHATRVDLRTGLTEAGARGVTGGRSRWPRRVLVLGEVALGVMLLVAAGVMIRTFVHLRGLEPGFTLDGVSTAGVSLQDARYATAAQVNRLFDDTLGRLRDLPGMEAAAVGLHVPYERWLNNGVKVDSPDATPLTANMNYVTPDYFAALQVPLRDGRAFDATDTATSAPVVIVNQSFVRRYLGSEPPIGRFLHFKPARRIVGVVGDVQQRSGWGGFGPMAPAPAMYIPTAQTSDRMFTLVHTWFAPHWIVRARDGALAARGIRDAIAAADPRLPVASLQTMAEIRDETLGAQRMQATVLGALAGLALLLAAVGIGGLIAATVADRTREMGIRLALGASRTRVIRAAIAPGLAMAVAGVAIGLAGARAAVRLLEGLVYGVPAADPMTFAAAPALLLAVAGIASLLPALRLLRLDPAQTLRDE
jgi:predicted permease